MLRLNKICALFLAAALAAAAGTPAQAAEQSGLKGDRLTALAEADVSDIEIERNGATTISIFQGRQPFRNVSFTVPLRVPMVVTEGNENVQFGHPCEIRNTSRSSTPSDANPDYSLAVVKLEFSKMSDSGFNTVAGQNEAVGADNMWFQLGGLTMPAMSNEGNRQVTLQTAGSLFLADPSQPNLENPYADDNLKAIAPGAALDLEPKGKVDKNVDRSDAPSVAQFQVKYVLSILNTQGQPLGNVYAGDSHVDAGLGVFDPNSDKP